jgi:hypothetical protein
VVSFCLRKGFAKVRAPAQQAGPRTQGRVEEFLVPYPMKQKTGLPIREARFFCFEENEISFGTCHSARSEESSWTAAHFI